MPHRSFVMRYETKKGFNKLPVNNISFAPHNEDLLPVRFVNKSPTGFAMGNHISIVINYQFVNKYFAHRSGDTQS